MEQNNKKSTSTHSIGIYLWIWGLLFVFSTFSYLVDWYNFQGLLRWSLIIFFMLRFEAPPTRILVTTLGR